MARRSCVKRLVSDELWELVEPLIPRAARRRSGAKRASAGARPCRAGRDRVRTQDRDQLERAAPRARLGSGVTCWRRLREWQAPGCGSGAPRRARPARSAGSAGLVARGVDSVSVRAKRRGEATGPKPTDRGKAGSKYHVVVRPQRAAAHAVVTGANAHDRRMLAPLLDTNPGVRERRWTARTSPSAAGQAARRQGLRLPAVPPVPAPVVGSGCGSPAAGSRTPLDSGGSAGSSSGPCAPRGACRIPGSAGRNSEGGSWV